MKVSEAVAALSALPADDELMPGHVANIATAAAEAAPPFWKGIVLAGLAALRSLCHLNGEQSAAWDVVTQLISAL